MSHRLLFLINSAVKGMNNAKKKQIANKCFALAKYGMRGVEIPCLLVQPGPISFRIS